MPRQARTPHLLMPLALAATIAALAPAPASAGWGPVRTAPVALPEGIEVALGSRGRGTILANDVSSPIRLFESRLRAGRPSVPTPFAAVSSLPSYAADGRGGLAVAGAVDGGAELRLLVRDRGAALTGPIGLPGAGAGSGSQLALNARGDSAIAYVAGGQVVVVVRLRGQAPAAPVALSDPSVSSVRLEAVDLDERGDVAAAWIRDDVAQARVRGATGALSPIAVLSGPGERPAAVTAAIDDRGVATAAAIALGTSGGAEFERGLLRAATRGPGGNWEGTVSLDARASSGSLVAAAAGRHTILAWSSPSPGAPAEAPSVVRAARRSGNTLRRTPAPVVTAGAAGTSSVAAAVAADGGAVLVSAVGGAIRAHVRRSGATRFGAPRVLSTIEGGRLVGERPVAAGSGGRALAAWNFEGLGVQVRSLARAARERTPRARRSVPRVSATPALLDLRNGGAVVRSAVRCSTACRVALNGTVRAAGRVVRIRRSRTLDRAGRTVVVDRLSPGDVRRIRDALEDGRLVTSRPVTLSFASRSGATVERERPITIVGP